MKTIFKLIKKITISLGILYAFNIITSKVGFFIPINIYTIILIAFFDFPGLLMLIILNKIL